MPVMNGFQLKHQMQQDVQINEKKVPYVFFSTSTSLKVARSSQGINFHGIFQKPVKHEEWKEILLTIVKYWSLSMPPDEYDVR
jgi:hypothetical protein